MATRPELSTLLKTVWAEIEAGDAELLDRYDRAWKDGIVRAGTRLNCRLGCIPCCMGPFEITPLDALRLAVGMTGLAVSHQRACARIRRRAVRLGWKMAAVAAERLAPGELPSEYGVREEVLEAFSGQPCPALSRRSGRCLIYQWRPLSCRSYGLPLVCGDELLPPCSLNLEGVTQVRWRRFAIEPDPEDLEGELLARIQLLAPGMPDTTVAGALMAASGAPEGVQR